MKLQINMHEPRPCTVDSDETFNQYSFEEESK